MARLIRSPCRAVALEGRADERRRHRNQREGNDNRFDEYRATVNISKRGDSAQGANNLSIASMSWSGRTGLTR
jgi:hypothetical protein